jgi:hypothetical protein
MLKSQLYKVLQPSTLIIPRNPLDLTRFSVFAFTWVFQMLEEKSAWSNFPSLKDYSVGSAL